LTAIKTVIKADGREEPFDPNKFNKKMRWAADRKVNWSTISLKALKLLSDTCQQVLLIKQLLTLV
jgi:transcriptional regulator NrdR family protein